MQNLDSDAGLRQAPSENVSTNVSNVSTNLVPPWFARGFRFGQDGFGERPWLAVPDRPDETLAASRRLVLAGPGRSTVSLSPEERHELYDLVSRPQRHIVEEGLADRQAELLARCPFAGPLPPIDLDPHDLAAGVAPRAVLLEVARRFDAALSQVVGGGHPLDWAWTGGKGLHGDVAVDLSDPDLLRAWASLVRKAARVAGIPLLSGARSKADRASNTVYLDDTILERLTSSRGCQWRLLGSTRPEGAQKARITEEELAKVRSEDLAGLSGRLVRISEGRLALARALDAEIRRLRETAVAGPEPGFASPRPRRARPLPPSTRAPSARVASLVEALRAVAPPPGARHEFRLAVAGWCLRRAWHPDDVTFALEDALDDPLDAAKAVRSTALRLAADLKIRGEAWLLAEIPDHGLFDALNRAVLGTTTVLARAYTPDTRAWFREALENVGEKGPAIRAIRAALRCQTVRIYSTCREHLDRAGLNSEDRLITCPHCAANDLDLKREHFLKSWPETITFVSARYADGRDPLTLPAREVRALRNKIRTVTFGATWDPQDWRWILGHGRLVYLGLGKSFGHTNMMLHKTVRETLLADGVEVTVELLDRAAAVERVLEAWVSPHRAWMKQVEARDLPSLLTFPWIQHGKENPLVRSAASKRSSFTWTSRRKKASDEGLRTIAEDRGGIDFTKCAHVLGDGSRCGKTNEYHLQHAKTGMYLGYAHTYPTKTFVRQTVDLREGAIRALEIEGKRDDLPPWLATVVDRAKAAPRRAPDPPPTRDTRVWKLLPLQRK